MITPIIILCLLSSPLLIASIISKFKHQQLDRHKYACWGLGIAFFYFFIGHMIKTQGMVDMLPAWVPLRLPLIYITGLLELVIGITLFMPKFQTLSAMLAIAVFVLFFPANIYSALNGVGLGGHQWGAIYLLIRTPLQIILIAWAYFFCIKGPKFKINQSVAI